MSKIKRMMQDIEREVELTRRWIGKAAFDPRVMAAMQKVPRHEFVPTELLPFAYDNGPLSIGYGQTISQPYIVALMTDLLNPEPEDVILEIGTGSGYQAAILAEVVAKVYSVEIVAELAEEAGARLKRLGYENVVSRQGDGYFGWPEHAPYDGIIVTAAAPSVPQPLLDQLKVGARLVIPVGLPYMHQELLVAEKQADGSADVRKVLDVAFVPLTGKHPVESGD
ncbi:MAG: protein-L-isoaspartate(D-aspartate) O-methyltransferase [Pseudomonadota bacterium]